MHEGGNKVSLGLVGAVSAALKSWEEKTWLHFLMVDASHGALQGM